IHLAMRTISYAIFALGFLSEGITHAADDALFIKRVKPILEANCLRCHEGSSPKGGLSLVTAKKLLAGGASGPAVVPGKPNESTLLDYVSGEKPAMPKDGKPLDKSQVASLREWIATGAHWPDGVELADKRTYDLNWWSLRPIQKLAPPKLDSKANSSWVRTP